MMHRIILTVAALTVSLSVNGCAVLTIDVDVYKGALINHESVQTEQTAAMAMGAKPLLSELRYKLEQAACFKRLGDDTRSINDDHPAISETCPGYIQARSSADFVAENLLSRDASRVNEILSLYEDATSQVLRPLAEAAERLIDRLEEGKAIVKPYLYYGNDDPMQDAESCADLLAIRVRGLSPPKPIKCNREPTKPQISAVKLVWEGAQDAWREALRILSSQQLRKRLAEHRDDAIWDVAWIAAELTSAEGLRKFLPIQAALTDLDKDPLDKLKTLLSPLQNSGKDDHLLKKEAKDARHAVEAVLMEMLADTEIGPRLSTQLAFAQSYAASRQNQDWFIVIYPTKEIFLNIEMLFLGDLKALRDRQNRLAISLGAGRTDKGLENLIDEYLKASRKDYKSSATGEMRRHLLDALVNFAEKVTIIANFDPLVRGTDPLYDQKDTHRYIRVLQAVGNSILSQVDALRQLEAHRDDLTRARDTELKGIRNAEARAASILKEILYELAAKPQTFPEKNEIMTLVAAGQARIGDAFNKLSSTLEAQRGDEKKKREDADQLKTTYEVLVEELRKLVIPLLTSPPYKIKDILGPISVVAAQRENAALTSGKSDEAKRWKTLADVLGRPKFENQEPNTTGSATDRYKALVDVVDHARRQAEKEHKETQEHVTALRSWHGQLAAIRTGSNLRITIPRRFEKDGGDGTAKDVLDVMLATLRYEHVNAMRAHGPDSSITKNLAAAIELNSAYRSGMIHIRPASTFLRNSYPATILQQDPTAGVWRNMLTDHAMHQVPFYDWLIGRKEEAQINKTIDKQFWQSVNQVRVSGTGLTNYAIAKDDVGNWYVKSYSSDPEPIIKSAKNLAMFSAGSALGANFLAKGAQPSGTDVPTTKEARSTLGKQFVRVSKRYEEQTLKARKNLKEDIEGLNDKLVGGLVGMGGAKVNVREQLLSSPDAKLMETLSEDSQDGKPKPVSTLNAEIASGLRFLKSYRSQVQSKLAPLTAEEDPSTDPKKFHKSARAAVDKVFKDLLDKFIKERQITTAQYELGLQLIGESAGL